MNTKNVSATNVRVNLTEVISELDANNRVAITKHGKVIAYLVAHVEEVASSKVPPSVSCSPARSGASLMAATLKL